MLMGYERHELCHHLAKKDIPVSRLAELYDMVPQSIYQFAKRHAAKIEAIRTAFEKNLDNEFVGMWVVEQKNRLLEYEADIEYVNTKISEGIEDDTKYLRIKHTALKSVAEELGALPTRTNVDHSGNVEVKYVTESGSDV
jgi:hypothetical protein